MLMKAGRGCATRSMTCSLNCRKLRQPGSARIHQRRLAAAERVGVGLDRAIGVAQVGVFLGAEEHVGVDVDEAGDYVETCRVDCTRSLGGIDVGADAGDLAVPTTATSITASTPLPDR